MFSPASPEIGKLLQNWLIFEWESIENTWLIGEGERKIDFREYALFFRASSEFLSLEKRRSLKRYTRKEHRMYGHSKEGIRIVHVALLSQGRPRCS